MNRIRIVGPLLVIMLALAACGGPPTAQESTTAAPESNAAATATGEAAATETAAAISGARVPLSLLIFEGENEFLPRLKEGFEAKHPNIELQITEIPEDQYVTKIDTALAANDPPDIGFVYGGQQRWLKTDKFLALDDVIATNNINLDDFNRNAMSSYCEFEGKVYCLGSYTGAVVLIYNKSLFDAAGIPYLSPTEPISIDEYAQIAAKLSKQSDDLNERVWGGSADSTWWWADWRTHYSEDGQQAEGFMNDEATVHAYEVLAQMIKDGTAPSGADMELLGDANLLAQGKQGMAITDNTAITDLEAQNVSYGVAPVPVERKGDQPWVTTWSDAFGVFSQSDHPEEAKQFVAYLGTEGNRLRTEIGTLPLSLKVAEELNWAGENPGRQEMLQAVATAREGIFVPAYYEIAGPIGDAFTAIVEGEASAQEAMDEAAAQVQDSLDQAWETWEQIK